MSKQPIELTGRDKMTQIGKNNSVKTDNRLATSSKKEWHDTAAGKIVIGIIVAVLATGLIAVLNLKK